MPARDRSSDRVGPRPRPTCGRKTEFFTFAIALAVLVVLVAVMLIMVMIIFPLGGSNGNGGDGNGPWTDMTMFKTSLSGLDDYTYEEVGGPGDLSLVTDPASSLYILIGLERGLTSSDLVSISDFLISGGKVIIADDVDLANDLTDFLQGQIGGKVTYTDHRYLVDKKFTDTGDDRGFLYNKDFIKCLVHPNITYPLEVIAHRPGGFGLPDVGSGMVKCKMELTVIDTNDNSEMDNEDIFRSYGPVCIESIVGQNGGRVQFFSTTGLFTDNVMGIMTGGVSNNERFLRADVGYLLPSGGHIYYDPSYQRSDGSPHDEVIPG